MLEDYVADIEAKYADLADGEDTADVVKIGGRVVAKRGQGKIMFVVRARPDGRYPALLPHQRYERGLTGMRLRKALDLGDIVGVDGRGRSHPAWPALRGASVASTLACQGRSSAAREVPRPFRQGDPLSSALCRPDRERGRARDLP